MSIYEALLLFMGASAWALSMLSKNYRGAMWSIVILLDLVVSTAWWRSGLPLGDIFTAGCDFSVCLPLIIFGRWRWEGRLFLLYQGSMLVSIADFAAVAWAGWHVDHDVYSAVLEAINYAGFIWIGGIGAISLAAGVSPARRPWRGLRPSFLPLFSKKASR